VHCDGALAGDQHDAAGCAWRDQDGRGILQVNRMAIKEFWSKTQQELQVTY